MKPFLLAALLVVSAAARAQTVVPPGSVPGAHTVVTPDMRNAGSPQAPRRDAKVPGLNRHDQKQLRKLGKVRPGADPAGHSRPRR